MSLALENYVTREKKRRKKSLLEAWRKKKTEISSFGVKQSSEVEEKEMFEKICVKVFFSLFFFATRWLLLDPRASHTESF